MNNNNKVRVSIFIEERLVSEIKKNNFESNIEISSKKVIMNPITIIDNLIIWYGKPITRTDFISQKNDCHVYYRPIFRFEGDNTAKKIKALLQN